MAYRVSFDLKLGRFMLFSMLLFYWGLIALEASRLVTPHAVTPALELIEYKTAGHQIYSAVWISLVVGVSYLAANYVANRIRGQEQALRELNETLEQRVKEQTARLERASRLKRYLAPQLVERLMTSDAQLASIRERRPITVMFADLRGFTPMVESLPPEVLADLLNHYFDEVAEIAFRHGGTIDKFIGDAVMVFFGAPESEDTKLQATRCVRMALEIQRRIGELAEEFVRRGAGKPLAVRIGIASGLATVGEFGARHRTDFTVVGAPVNRAARLEPMAPPGGVLIDPETRAVLGDAVQVTSQGTVTLKGFTQPIEAFLVDELRAEPAAEPRRIDSQRFWR
jgi:class 3 adenylate cyclase